MAARDSRSEVSPAHSAGTDGGPAEAATFISETVAELALLARKHRLDMLTHLLEMAQMEADDFARRQARSGQF